jgi:hypothetical protein
VAHVHDHHAGGTTTVVESDREGPATALIVLIGVLIIAALVWFFAFSGVVFNRSDNGPDININRNDNPPAQQNNNTNTNPDTGTQPNPVPS